nr:oxidoreductase-like domain-containing protein [Plasticicumulans acidivorans]
MTLTPTELPPRPQKPHPLQCCQRGCRPCIFDYWRTALARWEDECRRLGVTPPAVPAADCSAAACSTASAPADSPCRRSR